MNTMKSILCSFLVGIASASGLLAETVPSLVNYQSYLSDGLGHPLADGSYQLAFKIFAGQEPVTLETAIWAQSIPATLTDGAFHVTETRPRNASVNYIIKY